MPEYFHDHYAQPLHIRRYYMNLMPTGQAYMGDGLYLRPRDFMKLGQVFLDGGTWNGHRLVSEAWVERATAPIESLNNQKCLAGNYGHFASLVKFRDEYVTDYVIRAVDATD